MNEHDGLFRVRELLGEVGQRLGIAAAVETGRVWSEWSGIVGPAVAAHAEPSSLRGGVLRVRADSPAWASEIGYLGDKIKASVNATVGVDLVREVRVWSGPTPSRPPDRQATAAAAPPSAVVTRSTETDPATALERARAAWARRHESPR